MRNEGVHVHQAVKRMPGVLRKCLNYSVYVDDPVYATKPIQKVRYKTVWESQVHIDRVFSKNSWQDKKLFGFKELNSFRMNFSS